MKYNNYLYLLKFFSQHNNSFDLPSFAFGNIATEVAAASADGTYLERDGRDVTEKLRFLE